MNDQVRFLRTPEAAELCGLSPRTLERLRTTGAGPPYIRLSGRRFVVYDPEDVVAWLRAGRRRSTSDDPAGSAA